MEDGKGSDLRIFVFGLIPSLINIILDFNRSDASGPDLKLHPLLPISRGRGPAREHHLHPPPPPLLTPFRALFSLSNLTNPLGRGVLELLDERQAAGDLIRPDKAQGRVFEILRPRGGVGAPAGEESLLMLEGEDGWLLRKDV